MSELRERKQRRDKLMQELSMLMLQGALPDSALDASVKGSLDGFKELVSSMVPADEGKVAVTDHSMLPVETTTPTPEAYEDDFEDPEPATPKKDVIEM